MISLDPQKSDAVCVTPEPDPGTRGAAAPMENRARAGPPAPRGAARSNLHKYSYLYDAERVRFPIERDLADR